LLRGPSLRDGAHLLDFLANLSDSLGDAVAFFVDNPVFEFAMAVDLRLLAYSRPEHRVVAEGFSVVLFIVKSPLDLGPVSPLSKAGPMMRSISRTTSRQRSSSSLSNYQVCVEGWDERRAGE